MDEHIISQWNNRVSPDDIVYHLGDFAFCQRTKAENLVWRLNGTIYFIQGNHDKPKRMPRKIENKFIHLGHYHELMITDPDFNRPLPIILCHYPFRSWNASFHGSWHLHGHVHGKMPSGQRRYDVGVDTNNFAPISYEEIKKIMNKRAINDL